MVARLIIHIIYKDNQHVFWWQDPHSIGNSHSTNFMSSWHTEHSYPKVIISDMTIWIFCYHKTWRDCRNFFFSTSKTTTAEWLFLCKWITSNVAYLILTPYVANIVANLNRAMGRLISGCGCRIFKIFTWKLNEELPCTVESSSSFSTYNSICMDKHSTAESHLTV